MTQWLVTGSGGKLGSVLLRQLVVDQVSASGTVSPHGPRPAVGRTVAVDLLDAASLRDLVESVDPAVIVHAAAVSQPGKAFEDRERAHQMNVEVTEQLARLAAEGGRRMVHISTDMVFDGEHAPYAEADEPVPGTVYGRTKLESERVALSHGAVVVRVPLLYGVPAAERPATFTDQVRALREQRPLLLFEDEVRTPLWLEDAAAALRRVAESDLDGIVHAAGPQALSRLEMGRTLARALGVSDACIAIGRQSDAGGPEPRPRDLSLSTQRYRAALGEPPGRTLAEALELIVREGALS